jgi:hypothetical protein
MPLLATPLSASPILRYSAGVFSLVPLVFGIRAMLNPLDALDAFDVPIPSPSNPEALRIATSLMLVYGVRNVASGLSLLGSVYHGRNKVTGCIVLASALIAAVDGIVSGRNVPGAEWKHWPFVFPAVLVGVPAMGLLDRAGRR